MNARKHLLAVLALGASGFALAQSTAPAISPPPATQQSQAGTSTDSRSTMAQANTGQSTNPGATTPSQAPAAMPSTSPNTSSSTPAAQPQTTEPMRPARADRN